MRLFFRKFKKSQKGIGLIMMAVMLPFMALIMVFSIDLGLATVAQSRLESAVNRAATVSILQSPNISAMQANADALVKLSMADKDRFGTNLVVTSTSTDGSDLNVLATMDVYSYFGHIAGYSFYTVSASADRFLIP